MKRMKRILPLLLAGLLMLTLLPTAALADPPPDDGMGIPHKWEFISYTPPTCEEDGVSIWYCPGCGQYWTEYKPALGHDWDEGELTRDPEGFTAGTITYTCKNDPSHTREEPINPVPALIAAFGGTLPPPMLTSNMPRITLQPEGGKISRGSADGHTMTVAVEGGLPPYTYEWHYDSGGSITLNENAVCDVLTSSADLVAALGALAQSDWFKGMSESWEDEPEADWAEEAKEQADKEPEPTVIGASINGPLGGGEPSYTAHTGNCSYYCIVRDSAGQRAVSHAAQVGYCLRVCKQPKNTNLPLDGYAELVCEAADGTGHYTYTWMNADGSTAEGTSTEPGHFRVEKTGDYFCLVSDGEEEIASDTVTVYEAETLCALAWSKDVLKWPEESVELYAAFEGGTPPYTAEWRCSGETVSTAQSEEAYFTITVDNTLPYFCYVEDSMGQEEYICVYADERTLEISKQPEDCELPKNGSVELSVEVADGVEPITYSLRRYDDVVVHTSYDNSIPVSRPGMYRYRVEDALGHWAYSHWAFVSEPALRIADQTKSAVMVDSAGVELFVKAEGGTEPYTYEWKMYRPADVVYTAGWFSVDSTSASCTASTPGIYYCTVSDKNGDKAYAYAISVVYDGDAPLITRCSQDKFLDYSENNYYGILLYCNAIPAQGRDPSVLQYQWKRQAADGKTYPCGNDVWMSLNGSSEAITGLYYCVVTDTITGKSSTSRIIKVQVEMVIEEAGYFGTAGLDGSGRGWWRFTVKGGQPPYTVYAYEMFPAFGGEPVPVLNQCETINGADGGASYKSNFPREEKYVYPRPGGGFNVGFAPTAFFFVIKDASGQTIETDILGQ